MEVKSNKEIKVSLIIISWLVSRLNFKTITLSDDVEDELIQAYNDGIKQYQDNGFTDNMIVVSDKVNLFQYLIDNGIVDQNKEMGLRDMFQKVGEIGDDIIPTVKVLKK